MVAVAFTGVKWGGAGSPRYSYCIRRVPHTLASAQSPLRINKEEKL